MTCAIGPGLGRLDDLLTFPIAAGAELCDESFQYWMN